ncbi:MAG: ABC transporter ATP-binding protein [Burkholderiaceae bacterium]
MLEVVGLTAHYGASQALFGVDFQVGEGEVVTLLGRNGMGKTTTIHATMGMVKPSGGRISWRGQDITGRPSYQVANLGLGLVPEGRQIFPNLSARENLVATASNHLGHASPWTLDSVLDFFPELAPRLSSMGNLLSGGEQQMLAIGRALMTNPELLILDEATEGLAPLVRRRIWEVLAQLRGTGLSILVVDKNLHDLLKLADRHVVIQRGEVVWSGTSAELKQDSDVRQRYLGL